MTTRGLTLGPAPQARLTASSSFRMWTTACCLLLPVLQSSASDGFASAALALAAVAAALVSEWAVDLASGSEPRSALDGSAAVSALVLTLLLPSGLPPAMAAAGAAFGVLVAKRSFGGLGANWFNPALAGWLFVRLSWPAAFDAAMEGSGIAILDAAVRKSLSDPSGSPVALLKIAGVKPSGADAAVADWLNSNLLSRFGAELPSGYLDLLSSSRPGLVGDRGVGALLAGTIAMIAFGILPAAVPFAFLASYGVASRVWGGLPFGGGLMMGDALYALLTGGSLAAAFFLAGDPATGPKSRAATIMGAAATGAAAFALRFAAGDPFGVILSASLANLAVPFVRIVERKAFYLPGRRP